MARKAKTEPQANPQRQPADKPKSIGRLIREAVVTDEKITSDGIAKHLAEAGHKDVKRSTIDTYRTDTLATLAAARDLGRLRGAPRQRPSGDSQTVPGPEEVRQQQIVELPAEGGPC
jgi:hypothetical protein